MKEVVDFVKKYCIKYVSKIENNSYLAMDEHWNHCRNLSSSTVSFVDQQQKNEGATFNVINEKSFIKISESLDPEHAAQENTKKSK